MRSNSIDDAPAQVESARAELGLFALGEQLHCSGISDLSPPQAAQRLTEQGLTVSWRQMEYVDGIPAAAHRVTQPPPSHIIIDAHTGDPPSEVTLTIAAPDEPEAQERNRQLRSGC